MDEPIMRTDDDTMGGRIQRMRGKLGLSTAELASRVGVKAETMRGWERDRAEPKPSKLVRLAEALGVGPAWLMAGYGEARQEVDPDAATVALKLEELYRRRDAIEAEIAQLEALVDATTG
ncbi:helix-turn-helix domain-containing protein [Jiella sp. M17.18]|uniref:helix-turn-helix domain-containing protein n=1 Tax=Jiella sp. M17.18 TaxID=3234247 RepID=UPI0034DDF25C